VERTSSTEPQFLQAFWVLVENGRLVVLYHSTVLACPLRRISLDNGRPEPRPTGSAARHVISPDSLCDSDMSVVVCPFWPPVAGPPLPRPPLYSKNLH
jgi:hypothetical protein